MLPGAGGLIAAVSGGADSVCLLHILCTLRSKYGFPLYVVHVNHGIRGAEADADEAFVNDLAKQYGLPFRAYKEDIPKTARLEGLSEEEAGRIARRRDLRGAKDFFGAERIATAHHTDDQAETVLLMLCRGSGLAGASGIAPADAEYIRPLLCVSRKEIEEFLKMNRYAWREDATNREDDYTRNRLRHHVLPVLTEEINPAAARHIAQAAESAREALSYMREQAASELRALREEQTKKDGECFAIPDGVLTSHPSLQPYIVQRALLEETGSLRDIGREHIEALLALLGGRTGAAADLPGGISAVKGYGGIAFRQKESAGEEDASYEISLAPGMSVHTPAGVIRCDYEDAVPRPVPEKTYTKWIDSAIIADGLCVRTRRPGDYITVTDGGNRKSLSDYLINEKVPRPKRDAMPLIADGHEIVWIPGKRLGARYKITEKTARALRLTFSEC